LERVKRNGQKPPFWGAIIAQVAGAQVFFWDALPDYQELTSGAVVVGTPRDFFQPQTYAFEFPPAI
jgi:hypothetical protein